MILITGGLGFIGSHTARALVDLGESCVLTQRREPEPNQLLAEEVGKRVFLEQVDITDPHALVEIGERHHVTGIIHLAGAFFGDPISDARANFRAMMSVVEAAKAWGISRVGYASTIGVYDGGGIGAQPESTPLPLTAGHGIASSKKINEILASHLGPAIGVELYATRIGAIWGPLGRFPSAFFSVSQLVHAAVSGTQLDLGTMPNGRLPHADDGIDLMYVRECGRALALLQLADRLEHRVYNVSSGRVTTYREVMDGIKTAIPDVGFEIPEGSDPQFSYSSSWLDTSRLREDTGYEPEYDTERAVADYIAWLRAGNER